MSQKPKHVLTKNILSLNREYFTHVVEPSLLFVSNQVSVISKTYVIARKRVTIHFYGATVYKMLSRALSHHEESFSKIVDLTIHAWDSSTTGYAMIAPWDFSTKKEQGQDKDPDGFYGVFVGGEESLNFFDTNTRTGYFWVEDASRLPDWVMGAPFRTILHWSLNEFGIHLIHGAVVGQGDTSVLLTARSGSGKSTTSLSCVLSGMDYLADDYVAVESTDKIHAHSLYHSAKVTRKGLEQFPELAEKVWNKGFTGSAKAVIFLSDYFPEQVKRTTPLVAVLIPVIAGGITEIVPASKIQAMLAIAPTTLLQLPLAETKKVGAFKAIIETVPCYFLKLGPDVRHVPQVVKDFLHKS